MRWRLGRAISARQPVPLRPDSPTAPAAGLMRFCNNAGNVPQCPKSLLRCAMQLPRGNDALGQAQGGWGRGGGARKVWLRRLSELLAQSDSALFRNINWHWLNPCTKNTMACRQTYELAAQQAARPRNRRAASRPSTPTDVTYPAPIVRFCSRIRL